MAVKHVVVDGSNIATEGRTMPSLAQLDEAVRAFLEERPHDALTVVVDATFEHRIEPSERRMYDDALTANELITPPAGTIGRGDKFLLEIADRVDATVFSNDSFQEFHGEYEWLFDEGRLVGGKPVAGVGWIFTERTPVRGPKSRMATRAAGKKRLRNATAAPAKKAVTRTPRRSSVALGPVPVPTAETPPPLAPTRRRSSRGPRSASTEETVVEPVEISDRLRRRRTGAGGPAEPVNLPLPFIEFIAEHPVGSVVEGEVVEFASHGAYVQVGDVRCYLPLKSMGDPPPRSAREVLDRGALREFVVAALDAPRRGIDLALPGAVELPPPDAGEPEEELPTAALPAASRGRRRAAASTANTEASASTAETQAPARAGASLPESEATLAKQPAAKATAKRATATKAAAAKTTAKKATTRKATASVAATKATAVRGRAAKAPADPSSTPAGTAEVTARKAGTKAPAAKATTRKAAVKATVKAAPAKKAAATKATTSKAPARTTAAKASPARKSAVKATPTKATATKATTASKATAAKKSVAKQAIAKAPAKRVVAKKATGTATKSVAKRVAKRA